MLVSGHGDLGAGGHRAIVERIGIVDLHVEALAHRRPGTVRGGDARRADAYRSVAESEIGVGDGLVRSAEIGELREAEGAHQPVDGGGRVGVAQNG